MLSLVAQQWFYQTEDWDSHLVNLAPYTSESASKKEEVPVHVEESDSLVKLLLYKKDKEEYSGMWKIPLPWD